MARPAYQSSATHDPLALVIDGGPRVPVATRRARLFALWHQDARAHAARSRITDTAPLATEAAHLRRGAIRSLQGAALPSDQPR
mgnify:CR=1 FL=1